MFLPLDENQMINEVYLRMKYSDSSITKEKLREHLELFTRDEIRAFARKFLGDDSFLDDEIWNESRNC